MFCRGACSIEMTNKVIITGGFWSLDKHWIPSDRVTVYNNDGFLADWPRLEKARGNHGCGHFVNMDNREVMGLICARELLCDVFRCT